MKEKTIEQYLCNEIKKHNGTTRKLSYIGWRGCPDRIVFLEGVYFVELKRQKGGVYSYHQQIEQKLYLKNNSKIYLIHSKEEVDAFINEICAKGIPKNSHRKNKRE